MEEQISTRLNATPCYIYCTMAPAIIAVSPAVKDIVIMVKFKYACVGELWCMEPTKCTSERQGDAWKTNFKNSNTPLGYQ